MQLLSRCGQRLVLVLQGAVVRDQGAVLLGEDLSYGDLNIIAPTII